MPIAGITAELIRKACGDDTLAVHFLVGGTQANMTVIDAALRSPSVVSAQSGHINVHETRAVESLGHKVLDPAQGRQAGCRPGGAAVSCPYQ